MWQVGEILQPKYSPLWDIFNNKIPHFSGDATQIWTAEIGVKIEGLPLSDHYKINFHMIA